MSESRKLTLSPSDDKPKAAEALLLYITNENNMPELMATFQDAAKEYDWPFDYPILGRIYSWSRTRSKTNTGFIGDVDKIFKERFDEIRLVQEFINFYNQEGNWKSTSSKTLFMKSLIKKLPGYDQDDSITEAELERINQWFLKKAGDYIKDQKKYQEEKAARAAELKPNSGKVQSLNLSLFNSKKEQQEVVKKSYEPPPRRKLESVTLKIISDGLFSVKKSYQPPEQRKLKDNQKFKEASDFLNGQLQQILKKRDKKIVEEIINEFEDRPKTTKLEHLKVNTSNYFQIPEEEKINKKDFDDAQNKLGEFLRPKFK